MQNNRKFIRVAKHVVNICDRQPYLLLCNLPKWPEFPEQPEGGKIIVEEDEDEEKGRASHASATRGQVAEEFVGGGRRPGRRFGRRKGGRSCATHCVLASAWAALWALAVGRGLWEGGGGEAVAARDSERKRPRRGRGRRGL